MGNCPLGTSWDETGLSATLKLHGVLSKFPVFSKAFRAGAISIDLANHAGDNPNEHVVAFFVVEKPFDRSAQCHNPLGVQSTLPANAMSSSVAQSPFPETHRSATPWIMHGGASRANGVNYFQIDLGNEYALSGLTLATTKADDVDIVHRDN